MAPKQRFGSNMGSYWYNLNASRYLLFWLQQGDANAPILWISVAISWAYYYNNFSLH